MLGEILKTFSEFLAGFSSLRRFRIVVNNGFKITFGNLGIFLVPIRRRELIEVSLSQSQNDEWNLFMRRMHRLEFFEGIDRFGKLLIAVVSVSDFQFDFGNQRAERVIS